MLVAEGESGTEWLNINR